MTRTIVRVAIAIALLAFAFPVVAHADTDELGSPNSTTLGMQPIRGTIPVATPAPGESKVFMRPEGIYQAQPEGQGRTKTFHIVERTAPWTLKPGMTVMANTYNGVVPGPAIVVQQGDNVVIDYTNDGAVPDTIHLHGIHGIPDTMDGVPGISQPLVTRGNHFAYRFTADQPARSSITRTTTKPCSILGFMAPSSSSRRIRDKSSKTSRTTTWKSFRRGRYKAAPKTSSRSMARSTRLRRSWK